MALLHLLYEYVVIGRNTDSVVLYLQGWDLFSLV